MVRDYIPYSGPVITRAEAKAQRLTRYFTGKPCPYGHISQRVTASGTCRECAVGWMYNPIEASIRRARHYDANREDILAKAHAKVPLRSPETKRKRADDQKKRRDADPKKQAAIVTRSKKKRPHIYRAIRSAWGLRNPEKVRAGKHNAKVRRRAAEAIGSLSGDDIQAILNLQKHRCANPRCRVNLRKSGYHLDHIKPVVRDGPHDRRNIQALCPKCNLQKAAKDPLDWARENGLLL